MTVSASHGEDLDRATGDFYRTTLRVLRDAHVPFLVGGAYAFQRYTGISRDTKDFDLFVRPEDARTALQTLESAGYQTDLTFPHWLGKAFFGEASVDVIYSSGNGIVDVDDAWFTRAVPGEVLGAQVGLCPPEEMIRSKAYIMERERFDGADVAHLILARGASLDWHFMLERFGNHWPVLLAHLILFRFVYPGNTEAVPSWVEEDLIARHRQRQGGSDQKLCRGTLLSRQQYLVDIGAWGYGDARLAPAGSMTRQDIAHWTAAIGRDK